MNKVKEVELNYGIEFYLSKLSKENQIEGLMD